VGAYLGGTQNFLTGFAQISWVALEARGFESSPTLVAFPLIIILTMTSRNVAIMAHCVNVYGCGTASSSWYRCATIIQVYLAERMRVHLCGLSGDSCTGRASFTRHIIIRSQYDTHTDCNPGIPGFLNPGITEIFQSRNPGIELHSIPGLTKFIYLTVFLVLFKIILCIYSFFVTMGL